jgi:DNA-binding MarR family transcriptional regulator
VTDRTFPSKRLTFLLEVIAKEAIDGNDGIFLRELGCSIREIRLLRLVDDMPGTTFVDLWEKSGLERSLTSRIIQKLLAEGLITRTSSATDARKHHLSTTPKGRELRARGRALSDGLEALLMQPFPLEERARFLAQVERLGQWVRSEDYQQAIAAFDFGKPEGRAEG